MNGKARIQEALKGLYGEGEASAADVFRSWHHSTNQTGWHVQRFGTAQVWFLGSSVQEALQTIEDEIESREPLAEEWPPIS